MKPGFWFLVVLPLIGAAGWLLAYNKATASQVNTVAVMTAAIVLVGSYAASNAQRFTAGFKVPNWVPILASFFTFLGVWGVMAFLLVNGYV